MGTGGRWAGASDDLLVAGVAERDEGALQEAYRRHGAVVWAVAKRLCGAGERAERLCTGVFTELWARGLDAAGQSLQSALVGRAYAGALAQNGVRRDLDCDAVLLMAVGGCAPGDAARLLEVSEEELRRCIRRGMAAQRRTVDTEEVTR